MHLRARARLPQHIKYCNKFLQFWTEEFFCNSSLCFGCVHPFIPLEHDVIIETVIDISAISVYAHNNNKTKRYI
jgi:hypothetical protein